ncbi:glycosyltransferase family 4 protein [Desulfogranum marinum]|uniref:glycosyltransferase family 4 protein n=1 Tax=Desulfogranum marinum TaxID=453220 RepID=UPI0019662543|nr:glycosyltransferase family 4 protein [Desulfogranum marinum]MBM9513014.1 glycosyltransferase family 4 protein [Desulfogranum marinum]
MSKNILLITREIVPFYYGGIGTLFMSMANLFRRSGHCTGILTLRPEDFDRERFDAYYDDVALFFLEQVDFRNQARYSPSGGNISSFNLSYSLAVAATFERIYDTVRPDLVIAPDFGAEALVLLLQKAAGRYPSTRFLLHLSGGLHESLSIYEGGAGERFSSELLEPQNRLSCSMENMCLRLVDEIVTPTRVAWLEVAQRLKITDKVVHQIPNLFAGEIHPQQLPQSSRDREPVLLFIGRLDRHKGADRLLQVFIRYLEKYQTGARLVLLGRDCYWKEYEGFFLEQWEGGIPQGYEQAIEFKGQVDHAQVEEYLATATLCLFPSRWEVFGNVCLEAMAAGVPVFVAQGTGLEEVIGEELAQFAVDFSDTETVVDAIDGFLSDTASHEATRKAVRERAIDIVQSGEVGYAGLVDVASVTKKQEAACQSAFGEIPTLLGAMNDITRSLEQDMDRIIEYYGPSEDKVKGIVQCREKRFFSFLDRIPFFSN